MLRAELRHRVVLTRLGADVVCLSEDIPGFQSGPFIRAARRKGIPSFVIPFTIPNALEMAEACFSKPVPWYLWAYYRIAALLIRIGPWSTRAASSCARARPDPCERTAGHRATQPLGVEQRTC